MYTKTVTKSGKPMFFKDGKLISKKDIPAVELYILSGVDRNMAEQLAAQDAQTIDAAPSEGPQLNQAKVCIFCKQAATTSKYINGETGLLCQDDWMNHTTGEVAAQMRASNG